MERKQFIALWREIAIATRMDFAISSATSEGPVSRTPFQSTRLCLKVGHGTTGRGNGTMPQIFDNDGPSFTTRSDLIEAAS